MQYSRLYFHEGNLLAKISSTKNSEYVYTRYLDGNGLDTFGM